MKRKVVSKVLKISQMPSSVHQRDVGLCIGVSEVLPVMTPARNGGGSE
jgi:hypothetical protein